MKFWGMDEREREQIRRKELIAKLIEVARVHGEEYAFDLAMECGARCRAKPGFPCVGVPRGTVHFARRLRRVMSQARRRPAPGR